MPSAGSRRSTNFYPRPPRGGRPADVLQQLGIHPISIHALREEGDVSGFRFTNFSMNFYPRPPRGGRRATTPAPGRVSSFLSTPSARRATDGPVGDIEVSEFLSTPSARRATKKGKCPHNPKMISIHALREEGDTLFGDLKELDFLISIHALREEGDPCAGPRCLTIKQFLSTPSARRATRHPVQQNQEHLQISIHALREEGDSLWFLSPQVSHHFYPRPPRGGRQGDKIRAAARTVFLSTPSARRATGVDVYTGQGTAISIHALREEGDLCAPHRSGRA